MFTSRGSGPGVRRRARLIAAASVAPLLALTLTPSALAVDETADFGPGKYTADLLAGAKQVDVGDVEVFNDQQNLYIEVLPDGWTIKEVKIYVGDDPVLVNKAGLPVLGKFPYGVGRLPAGETYQLTLDLREDLGVKWGWPWADTQVKNVAVKVELAREGTGEAASAWAEGATFFKEKTPANGQWFSYLIQKPGKGHFVDSPAGGLGYTTATFDSRTDESGSFLYFPGESATFSLAGYPLGSTPAEHRVTPLDLFGTAEIDDIRVVTLARLLQSLDADGNPKDRIFIPDVVHAALAVTADEWLDSPFADVATDETFAFDFTDTDQIEFLIDGTIAKLAGVEGVTLRKVEQDEALANLAQTLENVKDVVMKKNVSKSEDTLTEKARIDYSTNYVPATKADGTLTEIEYLDAYDDVIETRTEAQPMVMAWTEADNETGGSDVYVGVSRDDGTTWKRTNLSRYADELFELDGASYPAESFKPSMQVLDITDPVTKEVIETQVMVVWTSSFAKQGRPRYAIDVADDYSYDDPYFTEDIWGVSGSQGSHDYTEDGFPEVGVIPYYAVWSARGSMDVETGEVTWYKPERLTSARRNAMQLALAKAGNGAGWGIIWQEDPEGIRPGSGDGPGAGWSGAIASNGTDIWYSYLGASDFATVDEDFVNNGDPQNDDPELRGRPKALVPWSLPVRVSDNEMVNTENLKVELGEDGLPLTDENGDYIPLVNDNGDTEGTREYAYTLDLIDGFVDVVTGSGETKKVAYVDAVTDSTGAVVGARLLDGDTGGTRPALFLQGYKKPDGSLSAWAIIGYEETKGLGGGHPDDEEAHEPGIPRYKADIGKNIVYHSFDFRTLNATTLVSGGTILNPQAVLHAPSADNPDVEVLVDESGNPASTPVPAWVVDDEGVQILDAWGKPIPATENARRPRFLVQGKEAAIAGKDAGVKGTVMVMVFKMGEEGKGGASDVYIQRWLTSSTDTGNPYAASRRAKDSSGTVVSTNVSSVTPTVWVDKEVPEETDDKDKGLRVTRWTQDPTNTDDYSWEYSNDSGQGQRGYLRGDFLLLAYTWTANFRAADNGNDIYNLYVRRSFDGGANFTVAPEEYGGDGVTWIQRFKNPGDASFDEVTVDIPAGSIDKKTLLWNSGLADSFEPARNITLMTKNEVNIIEPRTTPTAGTIASSPYTEDVNDPAVHWLFWGTGSLYLANSSDEEDHGKVPYDLGYTFSRNYGDDWAYEEKTVPTDSSGNHAGEVTQRTYWLAKGAGGEGEAQAKFSPDGSRAYVVWTDLGLEGDPSVAMDAWFARVMPYAFEQNQAPADPVVEPTP